MACGNCAVGKDGKTGGCSSGCSGSCSGGCNRLNTFDWLAKLDIEDVGDFDLVEVSFKHGSRKEMFHNPPYAQAGTGDMVLVEVPGGGGYDIGRISLSGDLVRLQMKKKMIKDNQVFQSVIRRANARDLEKLDELRQLERDIMIRARVISRTLDLDMKIGDVEYQGDGRKATFFYTADGRVDFRELIRHFAKEFKVKIEMRQIGARQESARVGGIGSCGRELCCSTWLSDFKSVSTAAARYQQLAINQAKLSGMCGRLKCCLNYELDTYLDALEDFPSHPERLKTQVGTAVLIKTDVFKGLMVYTFESGPERGKFYTLGVPQVKEVIAQNKRGEMPVDLKDLQFVPTAVRSSSDDDDYEDDDNVDYGGELVGAIELPDDKRKKKKKKKRKPGSDRPTDKANDRPAQVVKKDLAPAKDIAPKQEQGKDKRPNPPQRDRRDGGRDKRQAPSGPPNNTGPQPQRDRRDRPRDGQGGQNRGGGKDRKRDDNTNNNNKPS